MSSLRANRLLAVRFTWWKNPHLHTTKLPQGRDRLPVNAQASTRRRLQQNPTVAILAPSRLLRT
jgi:hypothetical protein